MAGISYAHHSSAAEGSHQYLYPAISKFLADLPPGLTVLDIECGNESFLALFRGRGWDLHGPDFSPTGIAIAQASYPDIHFFLADAQTTSGDYLAAVGQVDVILSTEVIEHLYDPRGFLRNCYSLLKPGGTILLSTPYHGYWKNRMLALTGKLDGHFTVLWDHGHIKFWSRRTLEAVLTETGFREFDFAGSGRLPYLWKSMILKATKPLV